jgi:hypothetical protein
LYGGGASDGEEVAARNLGMNSFASTFSEVEEGGGGGCGDEAAGVAGEATGARG